MGDQLEGMQKIDKELEERLKNIMEQVRKKLIEDGVKDELIVQVEKDKYEIKKHFEAVTMESY